MGGSQSREKTWNSKSSKFCVRCVIKHGKVMSCIETWSGHSLEMMRNQLSCNPSCCWIVERISTECVCTYAIPCSSKNSIIHIPHHRHPFLEGDNYVHIKPSLKRREKIATAWIRMKEQDVRRHTCYQSDL